MDYQSPAADTLTFLTFVALMNSFPKIIRKGASLVLFLLTYFCSAQSEVFLRFSDKSSVVKGEARIPLSKPTGQISFQLENAENIRVFRREIRIREALPFRYENGKITIDLNAIPQVENQGVDIHYEIPLQKWPSIIYNKESIYLNPDAAPGRNGLNPFESKRFDWSTVFPKPSANGTYWLTFHFPDEMKWKSSQEPAYAVEAETHFHSLFFEVENLDRFYFFMEKDALIAMETAEKTKKEEKKELKKPEEEAKKEKTVAAETKKEEDAKDVFQMPAKTVYAKHLLFFDELTADTYREIAAEGTEISGKPEEALREYEAYVREYGSAEAYVQLRVLIENTNWSQKAIDEEEKKKREKVTAIVHHISDSKETITELRYNIRYDRQSREIELSLSGDNPATLTFLLAFGGEEQKDSLIELKTGQKITIASQTEPEWFLPDPEGTSPHIFEGNMSDVRALKLYNARPDIVARYRALEQLFASGSPHLRATVSSFAMDDESAWIRNRALEVSANVPAFAASRLRTSWLQMMQEGNREQAEKAYDLLKEKLGETHTLDFPEK